MEVIAKGGFAMALIRKLRRILTEAFPSPTKVSLKDQGGIIGVVTSARFRNLDSMERQDLLEDVLLKQGLSAAEMKRILILVAVTPEEEIAHTATD